jgi:hypothetical protein
MGLRALWALPCGGILVVLGCAQGTDSDFPILDGGASEGGANKSQTVPRGDGGSNTSQDVDPNPTGDPTNPDGGSSAPGVNPDCAAAIAKATWDFEGSDQGWTHAPSDNADSQADWPFDAWSRGSSSTLACPAGECWGADLTQNYAQCSRGELISPAVDLSACATEKVSLVFSHAYAFWTGSYSGGTWFDGGIVELSNNGGSSWSVPPGTYPGTLKILTNRGSGVECVSNPFHTDGKQGFTGEQTSPAVFTVAVPASQLTKTTRIRFSTGAGVSTADVGEHRENTAAGWRIDNVHFTAAH